MKNKLLLGMFLFAGANVLVAQESLVSYNKKLNLAHVAKPNTAVYNQKALGTVVWHDNFDSIVSGPNLATVSASNWTINNSSQTDSTYGWTIDNLYDSWWMSAPTANFESSSGGKFAEVSNGDPRTGSSYAPALGVTYTLTSGPIDIATLVGGTEAILTFEQTGAKFYDSTYVQISLDGTTWVSVYDNQHKPMHTASASNPWDNPDLVEVDLSPYIASNASSVQIRFGWTSEVPGSTNPNAWVMYGWYIDDVKISSKSDYDLVYTYGHHHVDSYQYTQTPLTQVAPIEFRAGVRNQGIEDLTGVKLVLDINSGSSSEESPAISLPSGQRDTLVAEFTPTAIGQYTVNRSLVLNETDDNPANNSNIPPVSFEVTQHIYAVDKGAPFTEYPLDGLVNSQTQQPIVIEGIGTSYDIYVDQPLHAIDFRFFTGSPIGSEVYAEVYEFNNEATTVSELWNGPIGFSDMFTLEDAAQIDQIQTLRLTSPVNLQAQKTYLALIHISGTEAVKLAAGGEGTTDQGWIRVQGTQVWGTFTDIPVVRMNFDPTLSIENNTEAVSGVTVFPNPATDKVNIDFNLKNASDVAVEVTDITGKVVETLSLTNASVGANTAELNVSNYATGIYSVVVKSNDGSVTKKLVIR